MSRQKSKGKGSFGAKSLHTKREACRGCGKRTPFTNLIDGCCEGCRKGTSDRALERACAQDETFRP